MPDQVGHDETDFSTPLEMTVEGMTEKGAGNAPTNGALLTNKAKNAGNHPEYGALPAV